MTTAETRAAQQLEVTEEGLRKIQEVHKLFIGLWDDEAFIELWKSIPDDACSALINAAERLEKAVATTLELKAKIDRMQQSIRAMGERLVYEYAENGSDTTKEIAIKHLGENEFFIELLTGGYDLTEEDREDIAELLK